MGVGHRDNDSAHKKLDITETRSIDYDTTPSRGDAAGAVMTLLGQSWWEAQRLTTVGCWNVRTMAKAMWTAQAAKEKAEYGIEGMGSKMLQSGRERLLR